MVCLAAQLVKQGVPVEMAVRKNRIVRLGSLFIDIVSYGVRVVGLAGVPGDAETLSQYAKRVWQVMQSDMVGWSLFAVAVFLIIINLPDKALRYIPRLIGWKRSELPLDTSAHAANKTHSPNRTSAQEELNTGSPWKHSTLNVAVERIKAVSEQIDDLRDCPAINGEIADDEPPVQATPRDIWAWFCRLICDVDIRALHIRYANENSTDADKRIAENEKRRATDRERKDSSAAKLTNDLFLLAVNSARSPLNALERSKTPYNATKLLRATEAVLALIPVKDKPTVNIGPTPKEAEHEMAAILSWCMSCERGWSVPLDAGNGQAPGADARVPKAASDVAEIKSVVPSAHWAAPQDEHQPIPLSHKQTSNGTQDKLALWDEFRRRVDDLQLLSLDAHYASNWRYSRSRRSPPGSSDIQDWQDDRRRLVEKHAHSRQQNPPDLTTNNFITEANRASYSFIEIASLRRLCKTQSDVNHYDKAALNYDIGPVVRCCLAVFEILPGRNKPAIRACATIDDFSRQIEDMRHWVSLLDHKTREYLIDLRENRRDAVSAVRILMELAEKGRRIKSKPQAINWAASAGIALGNLLKKPTKKQEFERLFIGMTEKGTPYKATVESAVILVESLAATLTADDLGSH